MKKFRGFTIFNCLIVATLQLILWCTPCSGASRTISSNGTPIIWGGNSPTIILNILSNTASDLSASSFESITNSAISAWNSQSNIQISGNVNHAADVDGMNSIYFSASSAYLSSATIGVTTVSYSAATGQILEADIILNDAYFTFTGNPSSTGDGIGSTVYLGDVVTHELGHLLGLGHSEVMNSTMFYSAFSGQHSLSDEDGAAISSIYPKYDRGTITGKVVGSSNLVGVFGAHVVAISAGKGTIAASTYSLETGLFSIGGLPLDDTYYLFVEPIKKASVLSVFYSSAQKNFCSSGNYVGGFFSKCGDVDQGVAQGIYISSSNNSIDVGNMTIHCSFELPEDYLSIKAENPRSTIGLVTTEVGDKVGKAVTGAFFANEFSANPLTRKKDSYIVDLRNFSVAGTTYYLDVKLLSQMLFFPTNFELNVTRAAGMASEYSFATKSPAINSDGYIDFNLLGHYQLSSSSSSNIFTIEISPISIDPADYANYFPDPTNFIKDIYGYFMMVNVSKLENGEYLSYEMIDYAPYEDNDYCADAPNSYSVSAAISSVDQAPTGSLLGSKSDESGVLPSCASIDNGSSRGGPSQPLPFGINLLLGVLLVMALRKKAVV